MDIGKKQEIDRWNGVEGRNKHKPRSISSSETAKMNLNPLLPIALSLSLSLSLSLYVNAQNSEEIEAKPLVVVVVVLLLLLLLFMLQQCKTPESNGPCLPVPVSLERSAFVWAQIELHKKHLLLLD